MLTNKDIIVMYGLGMISGFLVLFGLVMIIDPHYHGYRAGVIDCKLSNVRCQATYDKYVTDIKYKDAMK
jgi:hypothetical protein